MKSNDKDPSFADVMLLSSLDDVALYLEIVRSLKLKFLFLRLSPAAPVSPHSYYR
jgi:hypothetical protein